MKIGFTGTRQGITPRQKEQLTNILHKYMWDNPSEFHHGDCVGADAQAHSLAVVFNYFVVIHPPSNSSQRAYKKGNILLPEYEYRVRNQHIVDSTEFLVVIPKEDREQTRSGTWMTYRMARKANKNYVIIFPNGALCDNYGS